MKRVSECILPVLLINNCIGLLATQSRTTGLDDIERILDAIAQVESGNNSKAVGDQGV